MQIFGELVNIFGKLAHIFAGKLVSRTSKQVSRNLGPSWQPGVYNDTNACATVVGQQGSRLSFPATGPPDPGTDFEAPRSLTHHRFRHLLEGFSKSS